MNAISTGKLLAMNAISTGGLSTMNAISTGGLSSMDDISTGQVVSFAIFLKQISYRRNSKTTFFFMN
jgi:hypothetical protein